MKFMISFFACGVLAALVTVSCSGDVANDPVKGSTGGVGGDVHSGEGGGGGEPDLHDGCERIIAASQCLEVACENESCGDASSIYDENGCFRTCTEDDDCAPGESCLERTYAPVSCDGGDPCECGNLTISAKKSLCGPPTE